MIDFDLGLITYTEHDADGFIGIQVGLLGEDATAPLGEPLLPYGLFARPPDPELDANHEPDPSRACEALYCWEGNRLHVMPLGDPRTIAKIPKQSKGSAGLYCAAGSWEVLDGKTGSKFVYVPYGSPTKSMSIEVNVDRAGSESISLLHGDGMMISMTAGAKHSVVLKNRAGDAYVEVNDDGITLNGNVMANGGMSTGNPTGAVPVALAATLQPYLEALAKFTSEVLEAITTFNTQSGFVPTSIAALKITAETTGTAPAVGATVTKGF